MLQVGKILTGFCISLLALSAYEKTPAYEKTRNTEEFNRTRPLLSFTDTPEVDFKNCRQQTVCTREFIPTICMVNGVEVKGNNRCEALMNLRNYACLHEYAIQREQVRCRQVSTRAPF